MVSKKHSHKKGIGAAYRVECKQVNIPNINAIFKISF